MATKQTIRIESILGGHSEWRNFSGEDQFQHSIGIDPYLPGSDASNASATEQVFKPSGFIRPAPTEKMSSSTINANNAPMFIVSQPKDETVYVFGSGGSTYSVNTSFSVSALGQMGEDAVGTGRGAEYYDNYIYFASGTDIGRYGPLNGSPSLTTNYWTGTLGLTALTDTTYPSLVKGNENLPNHVMYRHVDSGRMYIADVAGNRGQLNFVSTTKTTVEGDTDNSSTYQKVQFPFGYWPTDIETYGADLAIALFEGSTGGNTRQRNGAIAFWDTNSQNFNKIVELPDPMITALKFDPVSGALYAFSGSHGAYGTRITRFLGGYSFEHVRYIDDSEPPFPGAVDVLGNRILFGGTVLNVTSDGSTDASVWSLGTGATFKGGLFNIMGNSTGSTDTEIMSIKAFEQNQGTLEGPITGWTAGSTNGMDRRVFDATGGRYDEGNHWRSQIYRIGQPFRITRMRIPIPQGVSTGTDIGVTIHTDHEENSNALQSIDSTTFPNGERNVMYKIADVHGEDSFFLALDFPATSYRSVVGLPIIIDVELVEDE